MQLLSKCTDADGERQETFHWLDTAKACGYIDGDTHRQLGENCITLGRQLGAVMRNHESFCKPDRRTA